jgi:hypothetical protein
LIKKKTNSGQKNNIKMPDETEVAKRRLAYYEYKNKQIQDDKNKVEESKEHIDKVFEVVQQNYKENVNLLETPGILNWILKYPILTIKNLKPFSPNQDINNALFEIPNQQLWPKHYYQAFLEEELINFRSGQFRDTSATPRKNRNTRQNACRLEVETPLNKQITNKETKEDSNHIYFAKLIERTYSFNTGLIKGTTAWKIITGFIGPELKSEKEMQLRKKLDTDLRIRKERRRRLSEYFKTEPDTFEKFAEKLRQNILDFDNFCLKINNNVG